MKLYESDYELLREASAVDRVPMDGCGLEARQRIMALRDAGLLVISSLPIPNSARMSTYYQITQAGRDALSEKQRSDDKMIQDIADKKSEEQRVSMERKADIRREYVLFFLGLFLGWLLGFITPRDLIALVKRLVNWVSVILH